MTYCVCCSNDLGLTVLKTLTEKNLSIACVLTDAKSDKIVNCAQEHNIPVFIGNPREGKASTWIKGNDICFDHLLSINYLFIVEADLLALPQGVAVNFHGSLLPRYRGRTPTVWSIINGETEVGATAHIMNVECDDGDIIKQILIPIGPDDTGGEIESKFFDLYPVFVQQVINDIETSNLHPRKQDKTLATYFGKRTPDMGEINWDWHKERIHNWVRAQAQPWFPGAFSYCNGKKVIINKISYNSLGFIYDMPNGLVLLVEDGHPMVKTPNGVIRLDDIVADIEIKEGDILGNSMVKNNGLNWGGYLIIDYQRLSIHRHQEVLKVKNLPEILCWDRDTHKVNWYEHLNFIASLKDDNNRKYYAVIKDGEYIGTINFRKEKDGVWSRGIGTVPSHQGKGETMKWEQKIISSLPREKFKKLVADVRLDNIRSIKYHEKMGYHETRRDADYIYYIKEL